MVDLIIIGAGPGGYEAAAHAAKKGKKVILFEKNRLGGTCLNVGCIPTKTLLRSAKSFQDCKKAALFGVTCNEPTIDMVAVQKRKQQVITMLNAGIQKMLKRAKVEVIYETAKLKDNNTVIADGKEYQAKNILIATGSVPAVPPIPGLKATAVIDSTEILEMTEIPESLTIIGGGVIGLEFACFFAEFGCDVNIVEMLPRIAPMIDTDIAKRLQMSLKRAGVTFHLSCKVNKIDGNMVIFSDKKGNEQQLTSSYILNATGRTPVLHELDLDKVGIKYQRIGITVNERGETNIPNIWACGDVTGRCLLAHSATREGQVAVNNMFNEEDSMNFSAIPSVVYTHPEVASVGATEAELKEQNCDFRKVNMPMAVAGRFIVENPGESGTVKILLENGSNRILGVHMIGGGCGEFIASAAIMIESEMQVEDVAQIVFPHPTISESLREAILHG